MDKTNKPATPAVLITSMIADAVTLVRETGDNVARTEAASARMLARGQQAQQLATTDGVTDNALALTYFDDATDQAESKIKADDKETHKREKMQSVKAIAPGWAQAKSVIKTAIEKAVDLATCKDHAAVRKLVQKPRGANAGKTDGGTESPDVQTVLTKSAELAAIWPNFCKAIAEAKEEFHPQVAQYLASILGTLELVGKTGTADAKTAKEIKRQAAMRGGKA